jgi:hypothetical protein
MTFSSSAGAGVFPALYCHYERPRAGSTLGPKFFCGFVSRCPRARSRGPGWQLAEPYYQQLKPLLDVYADRLGHALDMECSTADSSAQSQMCD